MGYCVDWEVKNMKVLKENQEKALDAINELMKPENVKKNGRGGSFGNGGQKDWWYSWVENPPNNRYENLKEAFDAWGFSCKIQRNGDLVVEYCENEKLGQEDLFLEAIAKFVTPDSEVYVHGEDGDNWRWIFVEGRLVEQRGHITYS